MVTAGSAGMLVVGGCDLLIVRTAHALGCTTIGHCMPAAGIGDTTGARRSRQTTGVFAGAHFVCNMVGPCFGPRHGGIWSVRDHVGEGVGGRQPAQWRQTVSAIIVVAIDTAPWLCHGGAVAPWRCAPVHGTVCVPCTGGTCRVGLLCMHAQWTCMAFKCTMPQCTIRDSECPHIEYSVSGAVHKSNSQSRKICDSDSVLFTVCPFFINGKVNKIENTHLGGCYPFAR